MEDIFSAGRTFIYREGRLLDQRLFATVFEQAPPQGVLDALRGYGNGDGGFGHGLEPDKRCPASQPLDVETALQTMDAAGMVDREMVEGALDFLTSVSSPDGGVPIVLSSIAGYPRAAHWGDGNFPPGLNPTAGIIGLANKFGIQHPWIAPATEFCWSAIAREMPNDAHTLSEVMIFLEYVPDRARAEVLIPTIVEQLPYAALFRSDPTDQEYGLSPLHFAPTPQSRWRGLFSNKLIEAHLDRLQADQQPDGGWPVTWEPPSEASNLEWRGHVTLQSLRTLTAYGRLT